MAPLEPAIQTTRLTKRYRRVTALSDCSVTVPEGSICALIGPNGAGKTTLLRMLCGLSEPTAGTASVLGAAPRQAPEFLAEVGFLAQEMPLYRRMTAEDHIGVGAHLNARWDGASVRDRLRSLGIPLGRPVGTLSGGQRAQVALALVLAKQPRVLLLDEPVAALDPLARRHFLSVLTEAVAVAEGSLTVLLSSHLIADIERVCDHLILLASSHVQLCGDTDELLAEHKILVGPKKDTAPLERTHTVVQATTAGRQAMLLVRLGGPLIDPAYMAEDVGLEELVLGYMGAAAPAAYAGLASADSAELTGTELTALGIAAGALLRRTLPAIAVTLGVFIGVRLLFSSAVRPHLMPAVATVVSMTSSWSPPGIAWVFGTNVISKSGQVLSSAIGVNGIPLTAACAKLMPASPPLPFGKGGTPAAAVLNCMQSAGYRQAVTYQPGWRYWPFQGIEAGSYVLLAAALLAAAWYMLRRRDA